MLVKIYFFGPITVLAGIVGAHGALAGVLPKAETIELVRICDMYGPGYFYIPDTDTCLKTGGTMQYTTGIGDNAYTGGYIGGKNDTFYNRVRAEIRFDARSETELGTVRAYINTRFQYIDGIQYGGYIPHAYLEAAGFRMGVADEIFGSWTGYAGYIYNSDVIQYNNFNSNQISYTYKAENGFSAMIAAEHGEQDQGYDYHINSYVPHTLLGTKIEKDWGSISSIAGYDSAEHEWGFKCRLDLKLSQEISGWVMAAYQTNYDPKSYTTNSHRNWFGTWEGDYALWGGLAVKTSEKTQINAQLAYEDEGTVAAALNIVYDIVPGFTIMPEINYAKFDGARRQYSVTHAADDEAFTGILSLQRTF